MQLLKTFLLLIFLTTTLEAQTPQYRLNNFFQEDVLLSAKVDSIYNTLDERQRVAQMIITSAGELGKPEAVVQDLVKKQSVGGVIYLKGTKDGHKRSIQNINNLAQTSQTLPLLFSIDAEPSLLNTRIKGSPKMMETNDIKTVQQCDSVVQVINQQLKDIGFHHNYAPVVDVGTDNAAIKRRSFGDDPENIISLSSAFIESSQRNGIIATAKHFPGHGLVEGDTHKQSVYINGDLLESKNYFPLIYNGVLTVMVAHIVVKNNPKYDTDGLPATLSRKIVTDLLKNEMGFQGLVITDALNMMKAVTIYEDAPLMASKAGCDILLMPIEEEKSIDAILKEISINADYKKQVETSVKKILRLKICAGLL